jgi:uncharacterized membrane protein
LIQSNIHLVIHTAILTKNPMSPFDLKAALLAKHAQHPVIIHFPIALFIISVAFDLLAIWRRNATMAKAAYHNLVAAALTAPVAIASGLIAWQWQLESAKLKGNLLLHLIFALSASGMIWLLCGWRISQRKLQRTPGRIYIFLALATVLLIALAGHLGGFVSGVESGAP